MPNRQHCYASGVAGGVDASSSLRELTVSDRFVHRGWHWCEMGSGTVCGFGSGQNMCNDAGSRHGRTRLAPHATHTSTFFFHPIKLQSLLIKKQTE
jgi:hypothetical protein